MYEENIDLIHNLIQTKKDPYALLSFIGDTIDAMRTDIEDVKVTKEFYQALGRIAESLAIIDQEISAGSDENK
ncbi:hypothetical protein [Leptospira stimsonii]|uniref:Histidine kinase n=1 Tax=Leptospira stimsonii TaxID=2202203 RepID=A0A4R9L7Q6_9LEPT|nr:hypothetical protein [Leptospira stimsonii]RHX83741.1 hypothetical protein DLM78_19805 [Leptospira stimsonii]TGK18506.1 hypothetical protein EHO98_12935 [Leptospira stimsonii]TGM21854.1 hypothetical protein EHQ90_01590 [Leptospira stimsonii]